MIDAYVIEIEEAKLEAIKFGWVDQRRNGYAYYGPNESR